MSANFLWSLIWDFGLGLDNCVTSKAIVKLRLSYRPGKGQEGQSQVRINSENSKLKDLSDISLLEDLSWKD